MSVVVEAAERTGHRSSALEVLHISMKLGLTSCGGPIAISALSGPSSSIPRAGEPTLIWVNVGCCVRCADGSLQTKGVDMHENWPELAAGLTPAIKELHAGTPDVMRGFSALARAALEPKALDAKTKELIALGIAVAVRCDACIAFHAESAVKRGATREEMMETMGMAIYMGAGPSVMFAAKAVEAYDQFSAARPADTV